MLEKLFDGENIGGDFLKVVRAVRQGVPSAVFNAPFSVK